MVCFVAVLLYLDLLLPGRPEQLCLLLLSNLQEFIFLFDLFLQVSQLNFLLLSFCYLLLLPDEFVLKYLVFQILLHCLPFLHRQVSAHIRVSVFRSAMGFRVNSLLSLFKVADGLINLHLLPKTLKIALLLCLLGLLLFLHNLEVIFYPFVVSFKFTLSLFLAVLKVLLVAFQCNLHCVGGYFFVLYSQFSEFRYHLRSVIERWRACQLRRLVKFLPDVFQLKVVCNSCPFFLHALLAHFLSHFANCFSTRVRKSLLMHRS